MKGMFSLILIVMAFFIGIAITKPKSCGADCKNKILTVSVEEFRKASKEKGVKIIDVRTTDEYNEGHIAKSENNDYYNTSEFVKYLDSLDKSRKYLVYCRSGKRAGEALEQMKAKGFTNVLNLQGGLLAWQAANLPIEK